MDRYDCEKEIETNIEYDRLCRQFACEDVDEIVALIVDTLCATRPTIRIGGDYISAAVVRERFFRLTYEHLEYVFECLRRNTTEIRNIRGYLLTALYNALDTMGHYYQLEVQHDLLYAPPAGDVPDLAEGGAHSSGGGGDGGEPAWGRWAGGCCAQGLAAPG